MRTILLKIANLLYINIQYMNSYGLLNGKMGAALFFYEYGRYTNNEIYNDCADSILDDILEAIAHKKIDNSSDLFNGLGGVGWGIQYFINRAFVNGDSDEVLIDFDKKMQEGIDALNGLPVVDWSKYIAENDFLLGLDSYIFLRNKDSVYNMENLRKIADFYFKILRSDRLFPLQFLNACYTFIILNNTKMEGEHLLLLKNKLEEAYRKTIERKLYSYSDMKVLQRFEEQKERLFSTDYSSTDEEQDKLMFATIDSYLKYVKMELLSFDCKYQLLDLEIINKYLNECMEDMPSCNLSLEKGVIGVGLSILKALQS